MKASELIKKLSELVTEHGDLEVFVSMQKEDEYIEDVKFRTFKCLDSDFIIK